MPRAFGDMQIELMDRLGQTDARVAIRARRWINDAMHEVDSEEEWDYLFASTTGVAPLTIADLDKVESVSDVSGLNTLMQIDREALVADVVDLTSTGVAAYWYKTAPTTIAVFPVSTATLTVKYIRFAPDLSATTDAPLLPDRWRPAIVEKACAKAYRALGNANAEAACLNEYQRMLAQMRLSMITPPVRQARTLYSLDD